MGWHLTDPSGNEYGYCLCSIQIAHQYMSSGMFCSLETIKVGGTNRGKKKNLGLFCKVLEFLRQMSPYNDILGSFPHKEKSHRILTVFSRRPVCQMSNQLQLCAINFSFQADLCSVEWFAELCGAESLLHDSTLIVFDFSGEIKYSE